jgi:hypothetical protein
MCEIDEWIHNGDHHFNDVTVVPEMKVAGKHSRSRVLYPRLPQAQRVQLILQSGGARTSTTSYKYLKKDYGLE